MPPMDLRESLSTWASLLGSQNLGRGIGNLIKDKKMQLMMSSALSIWSSTNGILVIVI